MTYDFRFVSQGLKEVIEPATRVSHRIDSTLGVRVLKDAYIAPYFGWEESIGCVLDKGGKAIKDSECIEWKEEGRFYDINQSVKQNKEAVFLGFILTVFGHSYTDDLRKLWFVKTAFFKDLVDKGADVVYTTSWNQPLPDSVKEIIRLAGYDISEAKHVVNLVQYDSVIIPDNSFRATPLGRVYTIEYKQQIDNIKSSLDGLGMISPEKVYFTRSRFSAGKGKEYGEKAIERVFQRLGYAMVSPENHSLAEQLQFIRNCRFFAATEGSVAHLSLFCRPQTNVIIVNKANYLNFHQVLINEIADLNVTYIEAHHSSRVDPLHPWWGPFYLYITKHLEHFVGHRLIHLPFWMDCNYWAYTRNILFKCYNRGRKIIRRVFPNP